MADINDVLDAIMAETKESKTLPEGDPADKTPSDVEPEGGDVCWRAMKAARDRIRKACGTDVTIKIGAVTVGVPAHFIHLATQTRDNKLETIMDTDWCKKLAELLCSRLHPLDRESPAYIMDRDGVEMIIADTVVNVTAPK